MKISLIIPIYNEEKIIKNTLEKLSRFLKQEKINWEILLVNDGSTDNTLEVLKNLSLKFFKIVSYNKNMGKGFAIKKGVEIAKGDYICFIDSDLAYSFDNLKQIISDLKDRDLVIGLRTLSTDNHRNINLLRRIFGKGFNILSNIILGYELSDTQCGLKGFKKQVAKDLFSKQTINGFSFDAEILYIAKKRNYNLKKVKAIVSQNHMTKNSKVNLLREPMKMFFDLLIIRLNNIFGKYD